MNRASVVAPSLLLLALIACGAGDREGVIGSEEARVALEDGARGGVEEAPRDEPEEDALVRYGSEEAARLGLGQELTGDLDAMVERGYIRALVAYNRTDYFLDGPQQRGTSYELLKLFEKMVNERHARGALEVHVVPIPVPRDQLIAGVIEGKGDLALGGLTVTPDREELIDFSEPLMSGVAEIVVTGPSGPILRGFEDLSGQTLYVRETSSYYRSLVELNERFAARGLEPVEIALAEGGLEDEHLLEMVHAGIVGATVVDRFRAEFWAQVLDELVLHNDIAIRTGGDLAWGFRKDSPRLAAMVNAFMARNRRGTLTGNVLMNRYLTDATYVKNSFEEDDLERFGETVGYFRDYAARYDFDYLMMVAQGYQESELDQSRRSRRGAVGIMQLLPSTAADAAVGIPDITTAENNIHAGVRYMRWIRDTYFDDPALDAREQTLMSLASYNAGPNRIARLRRETAARGLDPNRWFRNVEILAAEKIGRETVDYVAHIYKYYAAYRLILERQGRTR